MGIEIDLRIKTYLYNEKFRNFGFRKERKVQQNL